MSARPDPDVMALATRLRTAAAGARRYADGPRAVRYRKDVLRLGPQVAAERDRLIRALDRGDAWLATHPDAGDYAARENTWLRWLGEYRTCEDALRDALGAL